MLPGAVSAIRGIHETEDCRGSVRESFDQRHLLDDPWGQCLPKLLDTPLCSFLKWGECGYFRSGHEGRYWPSLRRILARRAEKQQHRSARKRRREEEG